MEEVVRIGKMSSSTLILKLVADLPLCVILIGFILLQRDLVIFFRNRLIIKSRRITGRKGLFSTTQLDCPFGKVTGLQVEQGLFGKIFNYGTVCVSTASALLKFEYTEDPNGFKDALNEQIDVYEENRDKENKLSKISEN